MLRARLLALLALATAIGACGARSALSTGPEGAGASTTSAGGAPTTSTGGSAGGPCAPGEVKSCYDGPPGTIGVGVCQSGLSTCAADGAGFGPCNGQVLPSMDDCATPEDEDCDGKPASCLGLCWWSRSFGGPGVDWLQNATASTSGKMFFTGTLSGDVDLGGATIAGPTPTHFYVASLTPEGQTSWAARLGGVDAEGPFASPVPATLTGDVVFAGYNFYPLDFGAGPIASPYLLAELSDTGAHLFSEPLAPPTPEGAPLQIHDVALLTGGRIRVLVTAHSTLAFGATTIAAGPGDASATAVLSLDPAGAPITAHVAGAGILARGHLAVSESVVVAAGPIGATSTPTLNALTPKGDPLFTWAIASPDPSLCNISGVAVDASGNVVVAGEIFGAADLGGGPVGAPGAYSVFVTSLDPSGKHRWDRVFTEAGATAPIGTARRGPLALSPSGDIVMAGQFSGTTDLGQGPVTSQGETDILVVSLTSEGALRWARTFGGPDAESVRSASVDASGRVRLAGIFKGSFDAGCGPLVSKGDYDVFAAALLP